MVLLQIAKLLFKMQCTRLKAVHEGFPVSSHRSLNFVLQVFISIGLWVGFSQGPDFCFNCYQILARMWRYWNFVYPPSGNVKWCKHHKNKSGVFHKVKLRTTILIQQLYSLVSISKKKKNHSWVSIFFLIAKIRNTLNVNQTSG